MNRKPIFIIAFCILVTIALLIGSEAALARISLSARETNTNAPDVDLGQPGTSFGYLQTYGEAEMPYLADTAHLFGASGLFIDGSDNVYVVESDGHRLLRYNSTGTNTLSIGIAGIGYTDDYVFNYPSDAAVDNGGNIWVADNSRVVQYNFSGVFLQSLPARDDSPGNSGNTNGRFDGVRGLAFDSVGRMYVSDSNNHRIQVYDISTGSPVYSTTIGVTGVYSSTDGYFNNPYRIAVDTSNRLYVVDYGNNRVQQCIYSSATWNCTIFDSGLNSPQGIAVDSSNNVYISDTGNGRVLKCDSGGSCSDLVTNNPEYDVAVDSAGNIFGVDWNDMINKRDSNGWNAVTFVGVEGVPYLTDNYHYFQPRAAIDHSDNILILEDSGQRLIKLNSSGVDLWSIGVPGVNGSDNSHFSWPRDLVADPSGDIYVADTNNNRIQKCASDGSGCVLFVGVSAEAGSDNNHFNQPSGIAMDSDSNIYVGDQFNHRVQKCTSLGVCTTFAGVTGESGTDNTHFNGPSGIAVDSSGNVYVADTWNNRVQKCSSAGSCSTFAGVAGVWNDDFTHFGEPWCVALDAQGRVYITDNWNNRVQVFSSNGAYLTTIGGVWGIQTGQFRASWGVALDSKEDVYIGNFWDSRIQKFAPGVQGWQQKNINGFGDKRNQVEALEVFDGQLYASASLYVSSPSNFDRGARIWRTADGTNWFPVSEYGFGEAYTTTNSLVWDMVVFDGNLYAGTGNWWSSAQLWKTSNGIDWTPIITNGFGITQNRVFLSLGVFDNAIFASPYPGESGPDIWRSTTGGSLDWTRVFTGGIEHAAISGYTVFNGSLYAMLEGRTDLPSGGQIWRSSNGTEWVKANQDGFGIEDNSDLGGGAVFMGALYVGTFNGTDGIQVWRSFNGTDWTRVMKGGFGDANNRKIDSLLTFDNELYAVVSNDVTGVEVWATQDGTKWYQVNIDGFGDSNNTGTVWANATAVFKDHIFYGIRNFANGGEIWEFVGYLVHLPLVVH